jgi:hypothetical protein
MSKFAYFVHDNYPNGAFAYLSGEDKFCFPVASSMWDRN